MKKFIIKFTTKHRELILKLVPKKVILFCQNLVMSKGINDFERVENFNKDLKNGINVVGLLKTQSGLGQGARLLLEAIRKSKYDSAAICVDSGPNTTYDDILTKEFPNKINLLACQPSFSFESMISQINIDNLKGRYNIAYWLWELDKIPEEFKDSFKYVNEIWTSSNFVKEAFEKETDLPVKVIPYGINTEKNKKLTRKDFNIPEDKFVYLSMFSSKSSSERKNPMAAIDAFIKAFDNKDDDVFLVIKINGSSKKDIDILNEKLKGISNYMIIDEVLSQEDIYSLISLCDVFVSLHRSEGFGFPMAEAMSLGTVSIATNYSGNVDFMNKDNSCLVDYKIVPIELEDDLVYKKGNHWADPNIDEAADYMVKLYKDKKYYNKLKENAKKYIEENLSMKNSSKIIEKRIDEIIKENNF